MANEIPQMSLKQATLNKGGFTPIVYTPQTEDLSLLQRSLSQLEARQTSAAEQQAKFNEIAAKLQNLVNSKEKQWAYDYINKQSAGFKSSIESGDYGAALRQANVAGSNLLSTAEAMGRIKANSEYDKELKAVKDNNKINSITKQRWEAQNLYNYEDIKDDDGNIIGGTEWTPFWTPVEHYAVNDIQRLAANMTPEESNITEKTTSGSTLGTLEGKKVNKLSDAELVLGQGSTTRYNQYNQKTEEKLRSVVEKLLKEHPEYKTSLKQDYEDTKWLYMEADKKSRDMSLSEEERQYQANLANMYFESISDGAGNMLYDPNKYIEQTIFPMMKDLAYNNTVTKTNDSFHYSDGALGAIHQTRINKELAAIDLMNMTTTPGAPVSMNYGNYWTGQTFTTANFNMGVGSIYADQYAEMYKNGRITKEQYDSLTKPQ